jgi:hypothetical protein
MHVYKSVPTRNYKLCYSFVWCIHGERSLEIIVGLGIITNNKTKLKTSIKILIEYSF